jgi:ArsR family transcriptional regulator, arsenate/arsenite/antimonite-responsive transcriptional repressor
MVAQRKTSSSRPRPDLLFRAFADPTRLRILHLLSAGELCVCDLTDVLQVPQPKVSRHLAYLRRAGLVRPRREGLWSHYRLAEVAYPLQAKLLSCLACCLGDLPELTEDARKLARRRPDRVLSDRCCN